ncbi:hypothetical protein [Piscirickettsia salmonis]|uniref:hypothetical protein n=1 Tax=Piscirickettsia salmonis TaxID=1238 RepID=UPI001B2FF8DD|nr:hypothetical protein [Piscirickettsia salmonis]
MDVQNTYRGSDAYGNHIFASIVAFCKLETLSVKVQLNHFALKYKLLVRSNQIAFEDFRGLKCL